jgi:DDE superfamily endonuclease
VAQIAREKAAAKKIEIWFADEARVGQKNKITRRWALRGTRPSAPRDQRTQSTYIFGAICPAEGKAAGLVLPFCNVTTMNLHLAEISQTVADDAHAVLLVDQAGWHTSDRLHVPDNISIVLLPPKSPELNPTENAWQFMRDNWLSNRVFQSADDIVVIAAPLGTVSPPNPGESCPSDCANGPRVLISADWYYLGQSRNCAIGAR